MYNLKKFNTFQICSIINIYHIYSIPCLNHNIFIVTFKSKYILKIFKFMFRVLIQKSNIYTNFYLIISKKN